MDVYVLTVGTGTRTAAGVSDVAYGLARSLSLVDPRPDAFYLAPSTNEASVATAEMVLSHLRDAFGGDGAFRPFEADRRFFTIENWDDLEQCRAELFGMLKTLRARHPEAQLYLNPTSGTKPMTAAAVLAALELGAIEIQYIAGMRLDGVVEKGKEVLRHTSTESFLELRALRETLRLYERGLWTAGAELLAPYLARFPASATLAGLGEVLAVWDRFDYQRAQKAFRRLNRACLNETPDVEHEDTYLFCKRAKKIVQRGLMAKPKGQPDGTLFRMGDLLANAERRVEAGRYDDAVARLYRLMEMAGKYRLAVRHEYDPDKDAVEKLKVRLPAARFEDLFARRRSNGALFLGQEEAFYLLRDMGDAMGRGYADSELPALLKRRNQSLMAHGYTPVDARTAEAFLVQMKSFMTGHEPDALAWYDRCRFPKPFESEDKP